jgi:hypothetical protein
MLCPQIYVCLVPTADVSTCSTAIDGAEGTSRGLEVHFIIQTRRKKCAILITSPVRHQTTGTGG